MLLICPRFVSGVDYHFHREELYIALSNGSIVQYILSVSAQPNGDLIISIVPPAVLLYTAIEGNVLGAIAIDWLFNDMYWIEFEGSEAKVRWLKILLHLKNTLYMHCERHQWLQNCRT